jgi:N-acetylmuramoyl-L-alanine amidase
LGARGSGNRGWIVGLFGVAFVLGVAYVAWLSAGAPAGREAQTSSTLERPTIVEPTRTRRPTRTPRPTQTPEASPTPSPTPRPLKVGIVAGHWQSDSGAVCPDGLEEVTINLDVAARAVAILQTDGYDAELLPEFADQLEGYRADAFVSIHTDSCDIPGVSGFKVAHVAASAIPEKEDRLVACLIETYAEATGLPLHANSITYDMTVYHAFREIDPETPGAIIELGFMDADRELLTEDSYHVAEGVARGIICFLEGH